nr:MAG TPA: hypothetical protein [Caudoviricetes sp.]
MCLTPLTISELHHDLSRVSDIHNPVLRERIRRPLSCRRILHSTGLITLLYPCNAILETDPVIAAENVRKRDSS